MRTVIAQIYDYSLDGIIPEEGSSFFDFCRELPDDPAHVDRTRDFYQNADVLIMGRNHYQGAAQYFPGPPTTPTPPSSTQRARLSSATPSEPPTGPTRPSQAASLARKSRSSNWTATATSSRTAAPGSSGR